MHKTFLNKKIVFNKLKIGKLYILRRKFLKDEIVLILNKTYFINNYDSFKTEEVIEVLFLNNLLKKVYYIETLNYWRHNLIPLKNNNEK